MSKKVLVVDDDQTSVKIVESCLETGDYEIFIAGDGEEGLRILQEQRIDLIILDIQMPKMNGYAFILEVKKLGEAYKNIPVLILTAKDGMADIFKVEGAKEYIVKPIEPDHFMSIVRKYL